MKSKVDKSLRIGLLAAAACLSAVMILIGLGFIAFHSYPIEHGPFATFLLFAPFAGLPAIILILFYRRGIRWFAWIGAFANYFGGYVIMQDNCSTGKCIGANLSFDFARSAIGSIFVPQVFLSILVAVMVEYSCRLEPREVATTSNKKIAASLDWKA
jgi:hypothetical protein